jgi:hypothetical protein
MRVGKPRPRNKSEEEAPAAAPVTNVQNQLAPQPSADGTVAVAAPLALAPSAAKADPKAFPSTYNPPEPRHDKVPQNVAASAGVRVQQPQQRTGKTSSK